MTHKLANLTPRKDNRLIKEQWPHVIEHLENKRKRHESDMQLNNKTIPREKVS